MTNDGFLLSTVPNFRDLGGHRTATGRTVRHGLLYRSDALHTIDADELSVYNGLGIRQLVDLRTPHERETLPDVTPEGAEYAVVPVQDPETVGAGFSLALTDPVKARRVFSDGAAERFMYQVYRELVTDDEALNGYCDLVERAAKGPTALVFHCTAGKDRTGWGAALLLSLLGVDRQSIIADYLASNERQANTDKWMRSLAAKSGLEWEEVMPVARVRVEYLQTSFSHIDEVHGSFEGYVTDALGVSDATVERLRERMLV